MKLRCPNEPADKAGMQSTRERHEGFHRHYRVTLTSYVLPNGREWAFHNAFATAHDEEQLGPIVCATCGAEAIEEREKKAAV